MKKKVMSLFMAMTLCLMSFATVFAGEFEVIQPGSPNVGVIQGPVQNILGVVRWIGYVVAIFMIVYIGIKYLTAGAGQKAEVKSTMVPMLVGAILVALAPTLANWIFNMLG